MNPENPPQANLPLAIFLTSVIIGMALFSFHGKLSFFASGIPSLTDRSLVLTPGVKKILPQELATLHLIDLNKVTPYNIQARALTDGATQYVASYDTDDLKVEYDTFTHMPQLQKMFILETNTQQGNNFTLSFGRSIDRLTIFGLSKEGQKGTVVVSFYNKL